jgi:hypothetical protein
MIGLELRFVALLVTGSYFTSVTAYRHFIMCAAYATDIKALSHANMNSGTHF